MKKKIVVSIIMLSAFVFFVFEFREISGDGLRILLYHNIIPDTQEVSSKYQIKESNFLRQLEFLKEKGFSTVKISDLAALSKESKKTMSKKIMLTFDDGTIDHYQKVFKILKNNDMSGVFFIVSKLIGGNGSVSIKNLREMSSSGMDIESHGYDHTLLDTLGQKDVTEQLQRSKMILERIMQRKIIALAPPGGWFNDMTILTAKKVGYKYVVGCEIGLNKFEGEQYILKRIEVLSGGDFNDFADLFKPSGIIWYKIKQTMKFLLHSLIGSDNYQNLAAKLH